MNQERFHKFMNAVDDELLEEAQKLQKKSHILRYISVAAVACLFIVVTFLLMPLKKNTVTFQTLADMGFHMVLPVSAAEIRYEVITVSDQEAAQATFSLHGTEYTYQAVRVEAPQNLAENYGQEVQLLSWRSGDLDMQMLQAQEDTYVSWYTADDQTQWYLSASAEPIEVLTTASEVLNATGMNVTVAPAEAEQITYNVLMLGDMTVAETTFVLNDIKYSYRMAATMELKEDFDDLSELEGSFEHQTAGNVQWCPAKISFTEGGQGKIIWFDVVPGILYSLTMDKGADENELINMAHELFEPAQGDS